MRWRVLAGAVVLALGGAAAGYAVGASEPDPAPEPEPTPALADMDPVPAEPSRPVQSVSIDPLDPALALDIPVDGDTLVLDDDQGKPKYELRLPAPVGWVRKADVTPGLWTYTVPGNSTNTYGLRVQIIAAEGQTVTAAVESRIAALQSAETQGNMSDLDVVQDGNAFVATFIDSGGFARVNVERFYGGPDPTQAFATVALYGRETDRDGMEDLLLRITRDLRTTIK